LKADGGEDFAEAALDGIQACIDLMEWRPVSQKFVFHITDAPPHGQEFNATNHLDNYPKGCPCGLKLEDVAKGMNDRRIKYRLLKIGNRLENMTSIFKKHINTYADCELEHATKVLDIICGSLLSDVTELQTKVNKSMTDDKMLSTLVIEHTGSKP